ncbi:hypothetical protein [Streptomyces longwoodensis]|uniref:hypothetical protein n=1 Tax=Streptomyces longwoodensis TaxID=68231 RepID=UPI0036F69B3F
MTEPLPVWETVFYDFEFLEDGHTIEPVSFGAITSGGSRLYLVNADLDERAVANHEFLGEHVWPFLPVRPCQPGCRCAQRGRGHLDRNHPDARPLAQFRRTIDAFMQAAGPAELWADHAAYDHVCLAQGYGPMANLPAYMPRFTHDIQQEAARLGIRDDELPQPGPEGEHHALHDAVLVYRRHQFLKGTAS